jgi:hypothetical protein
MKFHALSLNFELVYCLGVAALSFIHALSHYSYGTSDPLLRSSTVWPQFQCSEINSFAIPTSYHIEHGPSQIPEGVIFVSI